MTKYSDCLDCAQSDCPFNETTIEDQGYLDCPEFAAQYAEDLEKRNQSTSSNKTEESKQ